MASGWRRCTDETMATFRIERALNPTEVAELSRDVGAAAEAGFRHLVLELTEGCEQSAQQWSPFFWAAEALARSGARLSIEGGTADLLDGMRNITVNAQLRWLEAQHPDFFSKALS